MENNMIDPYDPSFSPSEIFEVEERPDCTNCCDSGTFYDENGIKDFCDCASGMACQDNPPQSGSIARLGRAPRDVSPLGTMGYTLK